MTKCECRVVARPYSDYPSVSKYVIDYCPKHAAAPELYHRLKQVEEWCKGDEPLAVLWEIVQAALALVDGDTDE